MQQSISIKLLPSEAQDSGTIYQVVSKHLGISLDRITGYHLLKKSIDARSKQVWVLLTILVFVDEPFYPISYSSIPFKPLPSAAKKVVIVGAGPAGLFAALKLIELGIRPIILERGKDVKSRRRDLARINKEGVINPESNYC